MPNRFRSRRIPPESPCASFRSNGLRFREGVRPAVPYRNAFASDGRGLGSTTGFRRGGGLPSHIPGVSQRWWSNNPPIAQEFCSATGSTLAGITFAFPDQGRSAPQNAEAFCPYRRIRCPAGFHLQISRSPRPFDQAVPGLREEPHPAAGPFGQRLGRRLFALLQPGFLSCSGLATGAAFRLHRPGPFQAIPRPSTNCEVGFPNSPTPRSELHSR